MMKKAFGLTLLACGLLLTGCGNEKASTTNQAQEETKGTEGEGANSSQPQEELKAKIVDQVSYVFTDPYMETTTASYFAVVQNKSKVPVDITEMTVTFLDKQGTVLATEESSSIWTSPQILKPGQKTYLSADTDLDIPVDQFGKAELNVTPTYTNDTVKELPIEGDSGKYDGTMYVNGKVKNTTKKQTDYITVAAALYSKDGKFIGTTYGQVDSPLNAGASVGFETWSDKIPADKVPDQFDYEVLAYMYPSYDQKEGVAGEGGDGEVTE
jgi:hypothetical protein